MLFVTVCCASSTKGTNKLTANVSFPLDFGNQMSEVGICVKRRRFYLKVRFVFDVITPSTYTATIETDEEIKRAILKTFSRVDLF